MSFVPDVPPEDFADLLRYAVTGDDGETFRTASIFHKLAHSPAVFLSLAEATAKTLRDMKLDPQLRELAICTVTSINRATYPFARHIMLSQKLAILDEKLLALPVAEQHPAFDETERAVIAFARELTETSHVSATAKERLAACLDVVERVELVWTIGFYNAVSRVASACEVELEAEPPRGNALR
jgi:alkylhydroperoxidase family enzyme